MSDEEQSHKSVIIFGRDVTKIPCFRSSLLTGTLGGMAFGLSYFLFTSKVAKSVNYSVYSFSLITIGYWLQCRYQYSKTKFEMLQLQEKLRERIVNEGTENDAFVDNPVEVVEV